MAGDNSSQQTEVLGFLSLSCIFFVVSILFPRKAAARFLLSRYKQR
jgi:hypothetical protein